MNTFFGTKKKNAELGILLIVDIILYLVFWNIDLVILFSLGFIWNWVASHDLGEQFIHRRYRFSTLKTVFNLQNLIQKPFKKAPDFVQLFIRALPAGLFWSAVIWFIGSELPWWITFLGSLGFELSQLRFKLSKKIEEPTP